MKTVSLLLALCVLYGSSQAATAPFLGELYNNLNGSNWSVTTGWDNFSAGVTVGTICDWTYIDCNTAKTQIRGVELNGEPNLAGSISDIDWTSFDAAAQTDTEILLDSVGGFNPLITGELPATITSTNFVTLYIRGNIIGPDPPTRNYLLVNLFNESPLCGPVSPSGCLDLDTGSCTNALTTCPTFEFTGVTSPLASYTCPLIANNAPSFNASTVCNAGTATVTNGGVVDGASGYEIEWTLSDSSCAAYPGATITQIFSDAGDTTPPSITATPSTLLDDVDEACAGNVLPSTPSLTVSDSCDSTVSTADVTDSLHGASCDNGVRTSTRTFSATDGAGNTVQIVQTFNRTDSAGPTTSDTPTAQAYLLSAGPPSQSVTFADACGTEVTTTNLVEANPVCDATTKTTDVSFTAVDACGNVGSVGPVTYTGTDDIAPEIRFVIGGAVAGTSNSHLIVYGTCASEPAPFDLQGVDVDMCDTVYNTTFTDNIGKDLTNCSTAGASYNRTWSVTDAAGNSATFEQVVQLCADGLDPAEGCALCIAGPGYSVESGCSECANGNFSVASDCSDCSFQRYGSNCEFDCSALDCNGNGNADNNCNDGVGGNGECVCISANFQDGSDCELCREIGLDISVACNECLPNLWGPDCENDCSALDCNGNGACNSGIAGDGACACAIGFSAATNCSSCAEGYFGEDCDPCPECGDEATCSDGDNGSGECECDDGGSFDPETLLCGGTGFLDEYAQDPIFLGLGGGAAVVVVGAILIALLRPKDDDDDASRPASNVSSNSKFSDNSV